MFKPIKDFITFIQKNANSTSIEDSMAKNFNTTPELDEMHSSANEADTTNLRVVDSCIVERNNNPNYEEDDIELQIKSSVMIKKPSLHLSVDSTADNCLKTTVTNSSTILSFKKTSSISDYNQNMRRRTIYFTPEDDDELADFKHDPMETCGSELEDLNAEKKVGELEPGKENGLEKVFPDLSDQNNILLAYDDVLNTSIASSSDDPLALDTTIGPTSTDVTLNTFENLTNEENDEASTSGDVNWFNCDEELEIKTISGSAKMQNKRKMNGRETSKKTESLENEVNEKITRDDCQPKEPGEEMERNDNSDSGLGTETSLLLQTMIDCSAIDNINSQSDKSEETRSSNAETDVDGCVRIITTPSQIHSDTPTAIGKPLRSNLKRRFESEVNCSPPSFSIDSRGQIKPKKSKRSINFEGVHVFYFPRQQGFGCVPSAGGCTLGMGSQHIDVKKLSLAEHAAELRRAHRLQLQEINPRGSSSEDTDESEDYLSDGSDSDLDADSNGFLQPVSPKQRRAILKAAGVRKIDTAEKIECRDIRNSREVCGCTCREFCDPETCSCSQAGIKCQVDRAMFPCGCTRDACGNTTGRVEFNPARVRTHFIHTIMRLDMENRQHILPTTVENENYSTPASLSALTQTSINSCNNDSNQNNYFNMPPQSNYSSGYASPTDSHDPSSSYYLQQQRGSFPSSSLGQYRNVDSIDGHVFASSDQNAMQSYREDMPNYNQNSLSPACSTTIYQLSSNYTHTYMEYQNHQKIQHTGAVSNYTGNPLVSSYSSCAVPSQPPYGTAATCSSSSNINASRSDNNFISLSSPIASSSRLSQINDLLQNNRNNSAALVAVAEHNRNPIFSTANNCIHRNITMTSSIETPATINEDKKRCLMFEADLAVGASVNTISSINNKQQAPTPLPQSEPPPRETTSPMSSV